MKTIPADNRRAVRAAANDLRRDRHVERLNDVSQIQQFRLGNERVNDDGALQHSAEYWFGNSVSALRRRDADRVRAFDDAFLRRELPMSGRTASASLRSGCRRAASGPKAFPGSAPMKPIFERTCAGTRRSRRSR